MIFAIYPLKARALVDTPNGVAALRAVRRQSRAALPLRAQGHLPERGQPAALPPAAVRRRRQRHLGLRAGAGDGRVLRRAQVASIPTITVIALRALAARQRRLRRAEQRLALADPLPEGGRRGVPRQRPHEADRGRRLRPLLPEPEHRRAVTSATQWPKIGCVNFDRFKQAWWDAFHGTAQPLFRETGQSGGPFVRIYVDEVGYQAKIAPDKAAPVHRRRERAADRRGDAGLVLRRS